MDNKKSHQQFSPEMLLKKKSFSLMSFGGGIVLGIVIIFGIAFISSPKKNLAISSVNMSETSTTSETNTKNHLLDTATETKNYSDPETKVSFTYPIKWGDVITSNERGECEDGYGEDSCNLRIYGFSKFKNCETCSPTSFLAVETLGHQNNTPTRGLGWQDAAGTIKPSYLEECSQDTSCVILKNVAGVQFAKRIVTGYFSSDDPSLEVVTFYQVYSKTSSYYEILLSNKFTDDLKERQLFDSILIPSFKLI